MNRLLSPLVETFGVPGAALVLIYGGLVALLLVAIAVTSARQARRWWHRRWLRRELRRIHEDAYRERPRGPYAV